MSDNKKIPDHPEGFTTLTETLAVKDVAAEPSGEGEYIIDDGCIYIEFTGEALSKEDIEAMLEDPYKPFGFVDKDK